MDTLTRAIRDAADQAPDDLGVSSGQWVRQAWRSGRRRRLARGVASGAGLAAAAAVIVSLVLSGLGGMPSATVPADGSSRADRVGVSSYPQRIGHQWWVRGLPETPGPMAALIDVGHRNGESFSSAWEAVAPSGRRYLLDHEVGANDVWPVLSPDGTRVATITSATERLVVHDLVAGTSVVAPEVGPQVDGGARFQVAGQSPGFFSPAGHLALLFTNSVGPSGVMVVDSATGAVAEVPRMDQPAGWLDDDRLLGRLVAELPDAELANDTGVDLVVWDRRTGLTTDLRRIDLPAQSNPNIITSLDGQFWGSLRSDGTLWLSYTRDVPNGSVAGNQQLVGFDPLTGARVSLDGRPDPTADPVVSEDWTMGERSWQGSTPLQGGREGVPVAPLGRPDTPIVVVDGGVEASQLIWARDAIDGSPTWSPLGTSTFAPFWWWKELVLLVAVLAATRWWAVHRRRSQEQPE